MSDLDLLLTWKAWEEHAYAADRFLPANPALYFIPAGEFIDAFLDSWHSAYPVWIGRRAWSWLAVAEQLPAPK